MSHFVSHKGADFESLNHQLLQRGAHNEGDDDDDNNEGSSGSRQGAASPGSLGPNGARSPSSADSDGASQTPTSSAFISHAGSVSRASQAERSPQSAGEAGMSAALAARRRPDLSAPSTPTRAPSADGADSRRSSQYMRKNSPSPIKEYAAASGGSSSLQPPPLSTRASSSSATSSRSVSGAESSDKRRSRHGRDRKLSDPEPPSADMSSSAHASSEEDGGSSGGGGRRARLRHRISSAVKGVSFSDKNRGPGEESEDSSRERASSRQRDDARQVDFEALGRQLLGGADGQPAPHVHHHHHHHHHPRSSGMVGGAEAPRKLGTWDGVFMPVSLNILGIILFLRFGFILGQAGLLGALLLLILSYGVDALTAMSVSAISTNGQVRGGGAYYLISRSLGPEFGGSIGLVFFLGQALNAAMNVLGFVESLTDAFGDSRGPSGFLPEGPWWNFGYGSLVLVLSTLVCLTGSALFARATLVLAVVLAVSIVSIPVSSILVKPFIDEERGAYYTGWALNTLRDNLMPHFTSGAAGSSTGASKESWQTVFGVLFPAVTGILAGASMSGDLRKPSKSIPKGTNWSLVFTFAVYVLCFVVFAGTIQRESFYLDVGIVSDVAASPQIITFGALASTAFSALMGVMACGKVLQAIARDNLLPALDFFAQGTEHSDTPTYAVVATYLLCQAVLFVDSVNTIAQLVTMTSLLTFGTLSFATLALKAGGAPSFRPSFRYWNIWTAGGGTVASFGAMFFTDPLAASACIVFAIFLFTAIHVFCPPKPWGDVTRNLNYHIVRKYLLRLDERKGHVKYWRPQILLLVNNARTDWNLIIFCNSLKKGALYVLGHVLKGEFSECLGELRKQQIAWLKLVDISGIKSFVDVIIARDEREGARNLILSCGLGGMRPNVVVMGFPAEMRHMTMAARARKISETPSHRSDGSDITVKGDDRRGAAAHRVVDVRTLPTDSARRETPILATTYVGIMEDTLALNKALAIAYGFESLSLLSPPASSDKSERYIDLWPIQIQSPDQDPSHAWDTYTMVLQLGTILSMTGTWKAHKLRVSVFVELESDVEEESKRVRSLLDNLRVPATLRVFHLASGAVTSYQSIVWGKGATSPSVEMALGGDPWWEALKQLRREDERRAKAAAKRQSQPSAQAVPGSTPKSTADGARKQSKREQKMLGVSLPAEHLAFFKRNMRIGLAHPRAKLRREGIDSEAEESDYSSSDSDSSGLSDELARLGFEDDDWIGGTSPGTALRRTQTFSSSPSSARSAGGRSRRPARRFSAGASVGLPDEPGRRPLLGSRQASTDDTYGSLSATPRASAFMNPSGPGAGNAAGVTFPSGAGTQTQRSTIAEEEPNAETDNDGTLRASARMRAQASLLASQRSEDGSLGSAASSVASDSEDEASSSDVQASGSRHGRSLSEEALARPPRLQRRRSAKRMLKAARPASDVPLVSFNSLPNKAQYLILNELIRINSSPSTSVVLTALPAPEPGTSRDHVSALRYIQQLESLFADGPPMLGVHAKQLTMTSAL